MEEKLIWKIKYKQDKKAADSLVRAYYDEIFIYAYKQLGGKELAMDLTQEIFISALQSISSYNDKKASFRTWLYRVAKNKIIDHRRKPTVVTISVDDLELADTTDFTKFLENRSILNEIGTYIYDLDLDSQRIFRLRVYDEYSFPQIAEILSLPEAAIKTRFYRLLTKLRKEFCYENRDANNSGKG